MNQIGETLTDVQKGQRSRHPAAVNNKKKGPCICASKHFFFLLLSYLSSCPSIPSPFFTELSLPLSLFLSFAGISFEKALSIAQMTSIIKLCVLAWFMLSYVALALPIHLKLFSGDGTFYTVGLGSCGISNTDKDLVAALNAPQMGSSSNPNSNKNCGRKAQVEGPKGKVTVKIVSRLFHLIFSCCCFCKVETAKNGCLISNINNLSRSIHAHLARKEILI